MKNLSKIIFFLPLLLASCEDYLSQPPAKVEYHLEDYYGYGDVQGPYAANSVKAKEVAAKGEKVLIEDVSKDNNVYSEPESVKEEVGPSTVSSKGEQVYTVSDNVGPKGEARIKRAPVSSEAQSVNVSEKSHTVSKSETLFSISREYGVPILPIIVANSLEPPYSLNEGQKLKIPEGKFHIVQDGETLYSISREYGVDMSGIVKLNKLQQPYNVVKGQSLQIPFPTDLPSEETADNESYFKHGLSKTNINNVTSASEDTNKPASLIRPSGGVLGNIVPSAYKPSATEENNIDTEVENEKLANKTQDALADKQPSETKTGSSGFIWPIQGKVIKKFGQQGAEYNDGINISSSAGTPVKAANSGRVVYTGNSLKSYGNLVIIKHDNGLLSAYAHMNSVNVKKDQQISKGQTIGTVGSTGKVTSPQLYFAIRKGKDAKDPMQFLR